MKPLRRLLNRMHHEQKGGLDGVMMGIMSIAIIFIIFPIVLSGAKELLTDSDTTAATGVITAAGTVATCTLDYSVYGNLAANVVGVSSNDATDTPTVTAAPSGSVIVVAGLKTSATRNLTVTYLYDALTDYTGMSSLVAAAPLIIFIGVLGAVIAGSYFAVKGRR